MDKFIVTVDTEGDNLWEWNKGQEISTQNAGCIPRFQELCEKHGLKPVYLVDIEMAMSDVLRKNIMKKAEEGKCEIGMHLHGWNTPPFYKLPALYDGCPYITEYPEEVVFEKHKFLKDYIEERFERKVVSYRSGRWATDDMLFRILDNLGFLADCSVTPGISHETNRGMSSAGGNSYVNACSHPYKAAGNLMEIPMTTRKIRSLHGGNLKRRAANLIRGEELWLRPATQSLEQMQRIMRRVQKEKAGYAEFMIHSSELMPGGSPYCRTEEEVQNMYENMEELFKSVSKSYLGVTLREYYSEHFHCL